MQLQSVNCSNLVKNCINVVDIDSLSIYTHQNNKTERHFKILFNYLFAETNSSLTLNQKSRLFFIAIAISILTIIKLTK